MATKKKGSRRAAGGADTLAIEYRDLESLEGWAKNPKKHDLATLQASFARFGFVNPVVVDQRTGRVTAGHGRLEALTALKAKGGPAPKHVQVSGESWKVPVVQGNSFRSNAEAEAYLVADNQATIRGGWKRAELETLLSAQFEHQTPEGLGFSAEELEKAFRARHSGSEDPAPDAGARPVERDTVTTNGDVWILGRHRVMCGDCTNKSVVDQVTAGARVDVLLSDPPYCSGSFQESGRSAGSKGTTAAYEKIKNDVLSTRGYISLMKNALTVSGAALCYVFTDWKMWVNLFDVAESSGYGVRQMVVWDKKTPGMGAGWRAQHELVLFGSTQGNIFAKNTRKGMPAHGNVIQCSRTGNKLHATEKPVELLEKILQVSKAAKIETVLDSFLGSGSTLMAADRLGLQCFGLELDEGYTDVAVQRWQTASGQDAVLEATGETFNAMKTAKAAK